MKYRIKLLLVAIGLVVFACVEPYDLNFGSQKQILFIEADINDYDSLQYVIVKQNIPEPNNIVYIDIDDAKVDIIENRSTFYNCVYTSGGKYKLPKGFKIKVNIPYQLRMVIDGVTYESSLETANLVSPIDKIYSQFKEKGIRYQSRDVDGHNIYIDSKDSDLKGQNYFWQWRLFEKQGYCISCDGGRYFTTPAPLGRCVEEAGLKRQGITYDYLCSGDCWDIKYNDEVNVMSDNYTNGQIIKGRLVAQVPFFQYRNALIEIQQYSISKSTFDYLNILINQSQKNGTLADTPPAGLLGNVKNTSDITEPVGGIFMVSSKTTSTFMIQRDGSIPGITVIGFTNGRPINREPPGADTSRPPFAPCIESNNRTNKKPLGWID